jgi:D-lactate dehydrogenase
MKVIVFEFEEWQKPYFEPLKDTHEIIYEPLTLNTDTVSNYPSADIVSTFIKSDLSSKILEQISGLKLIATRSTGFDHIDLRHCKENNITVCNVPTYGENTIAEYVFATLLSLSRKIPETIQRTKEKEFSREGLQGFDLLNKTIGIIGMGRIGKHTAKIANGFGMNILAYDLYPDKEYAKNVGISYVSLKELLKQSDIITLHVPANEQTQKMIAKDQFSTMKSGAILINTARGSVVNHSDLLSALQSGHLSAAALDVFTDEANFFNQTECKTLEVNNKLLEMDNVIITPHNAYNTVEAVNRIIEITAHNIKKFSSGVPGNCVT